MELEHIAYIDIVQICAAPRATAPPLRWGEGGWAGTEPLFDKHGGSRYVCGARGGIG